MTSSLVTEIDDAGFSIIPSGIDHVTRRRFCQLIDDARRREHPENVSNSSGTYGLRNLIDIVPETAELVRHPAVRSAVETVLGAGAFMTRSTLFDKTPGANWGVFWHQDLSIAVREKRDAAGFTAWTRKAGVACVQPPMEFMERILAVRIHLDECAEANGALRVLPGSHRLSALSAAQIESLQRKTEPAICIVPAGGLLMMRPLLLHASSPMERPLSRRVVHLEFANFELPEPLSWKYRIPCGPE